LLKLRVCFEVTAQTTTTDADGCYSFDTAVSGKKGKVSISLPVFP